MLKEIISVNGMSCAHCEGRVNTALEALEGVKSAKASAKKNEVVVKFDESKVDISAIKAKIIETGYEVL
ncbi:MAG: copper ion binding protein [Oscillospiraceae bacterium]